MPLRSSLRRLVGARLSSGGLGVSVLAATVLFGAALPVAGRDSSGAQDAVEEILAYDVRVEVGDGGVMRVTEEIRVRALGREIRRGVYRDFPASFPRAWGLGTIVAPFRVVSASANPGTVSTGT